jgi:hypothetical protein
MDERDGATAQAETNKPVSKIVVTDGGILSISPRQYRQYADEWKVFTSRASSDGQRKLGQTMVEIWLDAAARFEDGLKAALSERGQGQVAKTAL